MLDINSPAVTGAVKLKWLGSLLGRLSCLTISLNTTVRKTKRQVWDALKRLRRWTLG